MYAGEYFQHLFIHIGNIEAIIASPESRGYQEIMLRMGFPDSMHAGAKLAQLIAKRGLRPICNVVDAYNIFSAKMGIPVGAHDIDTIKFPLYLKLAGSDLRIKSFGGKTAQSIFPGSLVYIDSSGMPVANIGKRDADSIDHAITDRTTSVLLTLMQHREFKGIDARNALIKVCDMLKKELPAIDFRIINPTWAIMD